MLTRNAEGAAGARAGQGPLARALRVEWLGQATASVCWICSVLLYGVRSTGDWLQLLAASAWLVANIAALAPRGRDGER